MRSFVRPLSPALTALLFGLSSFSPAQVSVSHGSPLITDRVDNAQRVVLHGNTRPEATSANDLGLVSDAMPLNHLQIVLKRSAAQSLAIEQLLKEQADPASPMYHNWLSNEEVAAQFGATAEDVDQVKLWLQAEGFTIDSVSLAQAVVTFSGNAGLVRTAFHAPLHNLSVNGKMHFANVNDPEVPAALAPAIEGVAALNNFMPRPMLQPKLKTTAQIISGNAGGGYNYLSAGDLAKIYNFNPLFNLGFTGKGQTVVVIEDTDLYSTKDWDVFRKTFGLTPRFPYGTLTEVHPAGKAKCTAPGVNGADVEAAVDVEWATAAAPDAAIVNAACADTQTQFGGFLALSNLLEQKSPPKVVSISYGEAEASLGSAENSYINTLYQTAALEGVSLFVSSGDSGAASADQNQSLAYHGIGISGFTSTSYNVSVGGTDFGNIPLHLPGTYFTPTNSPTFVTALSYIPEIPWNDSCAGSLLSAYNGYPQVGNDSFCNQVAVRSRTTASGSGGPSGCAIGDATVGDTLGYIVSGTCRGYGKPTWQRNTFGNPNDGVRDIPDVSLMASNGRWGSYYALCFTDPANGGTVCGPDPANWSGVGGTSVSSPIWAGIQAIVNQRTKSSWGNPNPVLYKLGRNEYGRSGNPNCDSTLGTNANAHCTFHDVTHGDIAVDCLGPYNCFTGGGLLGVESVSSTVFKPAYPATSGWDFATGLGTANAFNVVVGFTYNKAP